MEKLRLTRDQQEGIEAYGIFARRGELWFDPDRKFPSKGQLLEIALQGLSPNIEELGKVVGYHLIVNQGNLAQFNPRSIAEDLDLKDILTKQGIIFDGAKRVAIYQAVIFDSSTL